MSALLESLLGEIAMSTDARGADAQSVMEAGLPTARDEAWKYTSLRALDQRRFVAGDVDAASRVVDRSAFAVAGLEGPRLVFVNGAFRADLSHSVGQTGLSMSVRSNPAAFADDSAEPALAAHAPLRTDAFVRLNAALPADGPVLRVADDALVAQPVHLVFVGAPAEHDVAWQIHASIELGARAKLAVVEHHIGSAANAHLGNLVLDVTLAKDARLDLVQMQDAAEGSTLIRRSGFRVDDGATLATHSVELGAQLARHDFVVDLSGRGARFESNGVFALRGRQHGDTHLVVDHHARDTACDIVWRGVADQRARGVFHGAITVATGADGADARLSNKNLLLSAQAEIDTQPVLEIHADEVKAAHGATVGQLDERALFYLRSRGLPLDDARRLMIGAFCRGVLGGLRPEGLRLHVERLLDARLPIELPQPVNPQVGHVAAGGVA